MPGATRLISFTLGFGALLAASGAVAWWATAERSEFYSDGGAIRADVSSSSPRDILWRPPEPLAGLVNSPADEREPSITPDGDTMYFSRTTEAGDSDLFVSTRRGNSWGEPIPLSAINTLDNEITPRLTPDGGSFYFASDRPGSAGGFDIYSAPLADGVLGEPVRLPMAVNTEHDEAWPTLFGDGGTLLYSSNRPLFDESHDGDVEHGYSLLMSEYEAGEWGESEPLTGANSSADDLAPAVSPIGDFVYFASSREGSVGGLDLYRFRVGEGEPIVVESLGPGVNTDADETDPAPTMDGFAIVYATIPVGEGAHAADLQRIVSREVVLSSETRFGDWSGVLALVPWILLALALVLLLAFLARLVRGGALSTGIATLGLMARCVLVSLVLHAALLALLSVLHMQGRAGEEQGGTRVILTSSSVASSIAAQIAGESSELEVTAHAPPIDVAPHTPDLTAPSVSRADLALEHARMTGEEPLRREITPSESSYDVSGAPQHVSDAIELATSPDISASVATPLAEEPTRFEEEQSAPRVTAPSARGEAYEAPNPELSLMTQSEAVRIPLEAVVAQGEALEMPIEHPNRQLDTPAHASPSVPQPSSLVSLPAYDPTEGLAIPATDRPAIPDSSESNDGHEAGRDVPVRHHDGSSEIPLELSPTGPEDVRQPKLADASVDLKSDLIADSLTSIAGASPAPAPVAITTEIALPPLPLSESGLTDSIALPDPGESLALDEPDAPRLRGLVLERETREPIAGASVYLDREGASDLSVFTAEDGTFEIIAGSVPDQFALTATKRGYVASSVNVSERDVQREHRVVILLDAFDPYIIAMEETPRVHHLGNDEFSGRVNSQFQRKSEGTSLSMTFELRAEDYDEEIESATLVLFAKGVQIRCPVFLNGEVLPERLPDSPSDGSFEEVELAIPLEYFKGGLNTLEIQTAKRRDTDIDDFEFVNVRIVLSPRKSVF